AEADRRAPDGCAHTTASAAYQPPPRIREYVTARDQTCRHPHCGQPAWRCDLDHTIAYDQGGRTCPCDLGALCRRHHQLKQRPGWTLTQPEPGTFCWTTPEGRTYTTHPHEYYTG
ncbi:MAG TPA: HNH endonuclease signature motif containing protein, partial [Streptosporangiaceae bacterium]|nr:HNH endonuclease signature motif containing protein [Streptosporangiaceae bacterium]